MVDPVNRILAARLNSYHYLRQDAKLCIVLSERFRTQKNFGATQMARLSILSSVLSLEALINRCIAELLQSPTREFFLQREDRLSFLDKFELLPIFAEAGVKREIDKSAFPWGHFKELYSVRNEYVHPKYGRTGFYQLTPQGTFDVLPINSIPPDLSYTDHFGKVTAVKQSDLMYSLIRIPKDPYSVDTEHAKSIDQLVERLVDEMDKMLGGKVKSANFLQQEEWKLIYPPGATLT